MEISNARHQSVMAAHQLEQVLARFNCPKDLDPHQQQQQHHHHHHHQQQQQQEKKLVRPPNPELALKCPRCESSNTKFCYYNNYSLSQPRYFCKGCRRYWTQGGSLRNVPVGGGCRKNKRSSSSSSSSKNKPQSLATANNSSNPVLFPPLSYDPSDLSLAFTSNLDNNTPFLNPNPNPNPNPSAAGFLDILRGGGGFQNGYNNNASSYYVDDQACANMLPPFEGANNLAGATSVAAATAVEGSWIDHGNNVAVDSTRGYWNGGVGSYWHGLINSSLM